MPGGFQHYSGALSCTADRVAGITFEEEPFRLPRMGSDTDNVRSTPQPTPSTPSSQNKIIKKSDKSTEVRMNSNWNLNQRHKSNENLTIAHFLGNLKEIQCFVKKHTEIWYFVENMSTIEYFVENIMWSIPTPPRSPNPNEQIGQDVLKLWGWMDGSAKNESVKFHK